ncbi:MAG: C40 family peptidase [Clostridia bacterium]|nr:C40 family peptidase [Clostridia bacterium]
MEEHDEVEKNFKKMAKMILKSIVRGIVGSFSVFGGVLLFVLLIIIIYFGILGGTSGSLFDASKNGENAGQYGYVSRLVRINNDTREYEIDSDEFIQFANEFLRKNNLTAAGLGLSDDYSELKKFMEAEIATSFPDLREQGLKTHPLPDDEVQGCIVFHRRDNNGGTSEMVYMPYDEFSRKMAEMGVKIDDEETQSQIYTEYGQIESAYNRIKNYFTIDNEGNVYFASSSSHTVKCDFSSYAQEENLYHKSGREGEMIFNVTYRKVNYQNAVLKYSMPFELLFALQLTTKNSGYTTAVANMARNSLIVFEIQENVVNTTEVIKYNWRSHFRFSMSYHFLIQNKKTGGNRLDDGSVGPVDGPVISTSDVNRDINNTDFYEKITIGDTETALRPVIMYVDSWIAYYKAEYTNEQEEPEEDPVRIEYFPSEDWKEFPERNSDCPQNPHNFDFDSYGISYSPTLARDEKILTQTRTYKIEEKREGINAAHYRTTTSNRYEPPEEVEVEENVEKFLSLLAVDPELIDEETGEPIFNVEDIIKNAKGVKEYIGLHNFTSKPMNAIINDRYVLVSMLKNNEKTADVSETIDYLIKILLGEVKVDPTRREKYRPNPLPGDGGNGGFVGGDVREKLWWAIKDMLAEQGIENDVIVASAVGNTSAESGFKPNNLENSANSKSGYSDETFTSMVDNGSISKADFLAKMEWSPYPNLGGIYGYGLAQWTSKGRKERLWGRTKDAGLSIADENAQIQYLVDEIDKRTSVCYWPSFFDRWTRIYADDSDQAELEKQIREATMFYCAHFEVGGWGESRYTAALQAYRDFHNAERPASGQMQDLVNEAIRICNSTDPIYRYHSVANENCGQNNCFDCGGFIFYLYDKYYPGLLKGTLGNWPADAYPGYFVQNHASQKLGTVTKVGVSNLKPGDVLYQGNFIASGTNPAPKHHEMLYIGDGKIAHASGHNEAHPEKEVKISNIYDPDKTYVFRLVE